MCVIERPIGRNAWCIMCDSPAWSCFLLTETYESSRLEPQLPAVVRDERQSVIKHLNLTFYGFDDMEATQLLTCIDTTEIRGHLAMEPLFHKSHAYSTLSFPLALQRNAPKRPLLGGSLPHFQSVIFRFAGRASALSAIRTPDFI
jgi:hypothetical protein